jgi:hypothetical protein
MSISNTSILVKRSYTTGRPTSLQSGELGYSYASNTLFIGNGTGNGVVNVGGQFYTSTIDSSTSANTPNTLIKRDSNGGFDGILYGNANTATYLKSNQNFSISGSDITAPPVSFSGNNEIVLNASLNNINGLVSGYYGGSSAKTSSIPVIQVAANGRILSISNTNVVTTTSFDITDGIHTNSFTSSNTLYVTGNTGIVSAVSQNTISLSTDNTVARTNTTSVGPQTFLTDVRLPTNNMSVGGTLSVSNLNVSGNVTFANVVSTLNVGDPIIYLASNNTSDLVDIGFVGHIIGPGSSSFSHYQHLGFVRDYNDRKWKLFSNVTPEPSSTIVFDNTTIYDTIKVGGVDMSGGDVLSANLLSATSLIASKSNIINDLDVGGNARIGGSISFSTANATYVNVSSGIVAYGPYGGPYVDGTLIDYTPGMGRITVGDNDGFTLYNGGVSSRTPLISINSSGNITTATWNASTISVTYGGTGNTSFAPSGILVGNGTGPLQTLANTTSSGTYGSSTYIPIITVDGYGRISSVSNTAITFDVTEFTGILPVSKGGLGSSSFTNGGQIVYNGNNFVSLANVSTSNTSIASNNTINNITIDGYGRLTGYTTQAISGLTVPQGGTGLSSITTNGITFGNGTGNLGVTSAAGTSDQTWSNQILTVNNSGIPVWASRLDGGGF